MHLNTKSTFIHILIVYIIYNNILTKMYLQKKSYDLLLDE